MALVDLSTSVKYPRCAFCHREIHSSLVYYIQGKPYGAICAEIKKSGVNPKTRKKSVAPKFHFGEEGV